MASTEASTRVKKHYSIFEYKDTAVEDFTLKGGYVDTHNNLHLNYTCTSPKTPGMIAVLLKEPRVLFGNAGRTEQDKKDPKIQNITDLNVSFILTKSPEDQEIVSMTKKLYNVSHNPTCVINGYNVYVSKLKGAPQKIKFDGPDDKALLSRINNPVFNFPIKILPKRRENVKAEEVAAEKDRIDKLKKEYKYYTYQQIIDAYENEFDKHTFLWSAYIKVNKDDKVAVPDTKFGGTTFTTVKRPTPVPPGTTAGGTTSIPPTKLKLVRLKDVSFESINKELCRGTKVPSIQIIFEQAFFGDFPGGRTSIKYRVEVIQYDNTNRYQSGKESVKDALDLGDEYELDDDETPIVPDVKITVGKKKPETVGAGAEDDDGISDDVEEENAEDEPHKEIKLETMKVIPTKTTVQPAAATTPASAKIDLPEEEEEDETPAPPPPPKATVSRVKKNKSSTK